MRTGVLVLLMLLPSLGLASRIALVVGNGAYQHGNGWSALQGPANDASQVARVLDDDLAFDRVIRVRDADRQALAESLVRFAQALERGDTAFFFYSGHGSQVAGQNYLIPVDAPLPVSADQLRDSALALSEVLDVFRARQTALNIVVLDACRDNPLGTGGLGFGGRGLKGLSRTDIAGSGLEGVSRSEFMGETLIAFATAPGRVAADGSGGMSPYSRVLVDELRRPGRSLWEVFGAVTSRVRKQTAASSYPQEPWKTDTLTKNHYMIGNPRVGFQDTRAEVSRVLKENQMGNLDIFLDKDGSLTLSGVLDSEAKVHRIKSIISSVDDVNKLRINFALRPFEERGVRYDQEELQAQYDPWMNMMRLRLVAEGFGGISLQVGNDGVVVVSASTILPSMRAD